MTASVILAAGSGCRLGGVAKALLVCEGRTFLERIVSLVRGPSVVVVGAPFGDAVAEHARSLEDVHVVVNPDPSRGMASSIALGFQHLQAFQRNDAWLWPVDHPFVTAETLTALLDADADVARPIYQGRGGHPPLIRRTCWQAFAACDEVEGGARGVMSKLRVVDVVVDDPGVVRDVDTSEDRKALS